MMSVNDSPSTVYAAAGGGVVWAVWGEVGYYPSGMLVVAPLKPILRVGQHVEVVGCDGG